MGGSVSLARDFGIARECDSKSKKEKVMDIYNNEIGFNIIEENPEIIDLLSLSDNYSIGIFSIIEKICDALTNGEMIVLSNPNEQFPVNDENSNNILIPSNSCSCQN